MDKNSKGNILLGTQDLERRAPSTGSISWSPLPEQIEAFLVSRQTTLPADARITGAEYARAFRDYLAQALDDKQSCEGAGGRPARALQSDGPDRGGLDDRAGASSPTCFAFRSNNTRAWRMTIWRERRSPLSARAIRQPGLPDAHGRCRRPYPSKSLRKSFCAWNATRWWCAESGSTLERATTEWHFRHDTIMEYFIVQTFLGESNERPEQHFSDKRFLVSIYSWPR